MIITYSTGKAEGIIEYLESGQHKDRDYSRQELDLQIPILGDKEETRYIIKNVKTKYPPRVDKETGEVKEGERYKHFTLSFKEDHIPEKWLKDIAVEFRNFLLSEYRTKEANIYIEAHLPKIKNYMSKNGNLITRKPHIHIVLPVINLLTGTKTLSFGLNRFGFKEYLLAFQEYINCKYGLESPLSMNNRNLLIQHAQVMHEKGAALLENNGREFRVQTLIDIIENRISDQQSLRDFLMKKYTHIESIENSFDDKYLVVNLKHETVADEINNNKKDVIHLKDYIYSDDFLALGKSLQIKLAEDFFSRKSQTVSQVVLPKAPQELSHENKILMDKWHSFGKLEQKYGRMIGSLKWKEYSELDEAGKKNMLLEIKNQFYSKIEQPYYDKQAYEYTNKVKSVLPPITTDHKTISYETIDKINSYSKELFLNILEKRYGLNIAHYLDKTEANSIYSYKESRKLNYSDFLKTELNLDNDDLKVLVQNVHDYKVSTTPSKRFNAISSLIKEYQYNDSVSPPRFEAKAANEFEQDMNSFIEDFRRFSSSGRKQQKQEMSAQHIDISQREAEKYKENGQKVINERYQDYLNQIRKELEGRTKAQEQVLKELDKWLLATQRQLDKQTKSVAKLAIRDLINYSSGSGYNKLAVDNRFKYYLLDNLNKYPTLTDEMKDFIRNIIPLDKDLANKVESSPELSKILGVTKINSPKPNYSDLINKDGILDFNKFLGR